VRLTQEEGIDVSKIEREQGKDVMVRLRAGGGGRPLFLVHPTHGQGLCYGGLAVMLGSKHPVYALTSAGLAGGEPDRSIERMAQRYVERIVQHDPQGPYLLGGWSQGASIALEMAQILRSSGREVAHLFSIDNLLMTTDVSPLTGERIDGDFLVLNLLFQQVTTPQALHEFKSLDEAGKIDHLLALATERKMYSPSMDRLMVRRMLEVFYLNCLAGWHYDKSRIDGYLEGLPLTYFMATESAPFERERKGYLMLRDQFMAQRSRQSPVIPIHGATHFNLLSMPHVKELATALTAALERVQDVA
jgi:thioesterase domain-containing protein